MTSIERVDPPLASPTRRDTLLAFLDYHRDTLRPKTEGLTQEQLAQPLAAVSTMTLGGLLKHLALVEDYWFSVVLMGNEDAEPWQPSTGTPTPTGSGAPPPTTRPEELRRAASTTRVAASDRNIRQALDEGGLDRLSVRESRRAEERSLQPALDPRCT